MMDHNVRPGCRPKYNVKSMRNHARQFFGRVWFSAGILIAALSFGGVALAAAERELTAEEQKKLDEFRAELEIGRNMAGRLITFYGEYNDESLNDYLNLIGNYVAQQGPYADRRYMIRLLNSESVNAFACPGGYILVTKGALRQATNEAELAAILGHEAAHVGNRHMMNTLLTMDQEKLKATAAKAGKKPDRSPGMRMRKRVDMSEQSETAKTLARYLGTSAVAGLSIVAAAKAGLSLILEKGLDHKLEFEADREGVKYAVAAGYDPRAMANFLGRLVARQKSLNTKTLEKTHPKASDRKEMVEQLLAQIDAKSIVGAEGVERFAAMQSRLPGVSGGKVKKSGQSDKEKKGRTVPGKPMQQPKQKTAKNKSEK